MSLEDNVLEYIEENAITHMAYLTYISLSGNKLTRIYVDTFPNRYSTLHLYINLEGNAISQIDADSFNFSTASGISLNDNNLTCIPQQSVRCEHCCNQKIFYLEGNDNLNCHCNMKWIKKLCNTRKHHHKKAAVDIDNVFQLRCKLKLLGQQKPKRVQICAFKSGEFFAALLNQLAQRNRHRVVATPIAQMDVCVMPPKSLGNK